MFACSFLSSVFQKSKRGFVCFAWTASRGVNIAPEMGNEVPETGGVVASRPEMGVVLTFQDFPFEWTPDAEVMSIGFGMRC